jgi:hypothetical protein
VRPDGEGERPFFFLLGACRLIAVVEAEDEEEEVVEIFTGVLGVVGIALAPLVAASRTGKLNGAIVSPFSPSEVVTDGVVVVVVVVGVVDSLTCVALVVVVVGVVVLAVVESNLNVVAAPELAPSEEIGENEGDFSSVGEAKRSGSFLSFRALRCQPNPE